LDIILVPLLQLINTVIQLYIWAIIAYIVLHWLLVFNVINAKNNFVSIVIETLFRITEPVLASIRRILPNLGGLDLSPVVLILGLYFIENLINRLALRFI
jgi:YggT family protein